MTTVMDASPERTPHTAPAVERAPVEAPTVEALVKERARLVKRVRKVFAAKAAPDVLLFVDDLRDCRACGEPSRVRTPRGAPVHPACEGWLGSLTYEAEVDVLWMTATALGASLDTRPVPPNTRRTDPVPIQAGPCSWCGQPGIGLAADEQLHCKAHMWPPYRWPPPEGTPVVQTWQGGN